MNKARKISPLMIVFVVMFAIIALTSVQSFTKFYQNSKETSVKSIEDSLMKACIQCYALEGSYPASLQDLNENYGIQLDEEKYFYHYELFASNIAPVIAVVLKGD